MYHPSGPRKVYATPSFLFPFETRVTVTMVIALRDIRGGLFPLCVAAGSWGYESDWHQRCKTPLRHITLHCIVSGFGINARRQYLGTRPCFLHLLQCFGKKNSWPGSPDGWIVLSAWEEKQRKVTQGTAWVHARSGSTNREKYIYCNTKRWRRHYQNTARKTSVLPLPVPLSLPGYWFTFPGKLVI